MADCRLVDWRVRLMRQLNSSHQQAYEAVTGRSNPCRRSIRQGHYFEPDEEASQMYVFHVPQGAFDHIRLTYDVVNGREGSADWEKITTGYRVQDDPGARARANKAAPGFRRTGRPVKWEGASASGACTK